MGWAEQRQLLLQLLEYFEVAGSSYCHRAAAATAASAGAAAATAASAEAAAATAASAGAAAVTAVSAEGAAHGGSLPGPVPVRAQ